MDRNTEYVVFRFPCRLVLTRILTWARVWRVAEREGHSSGPTSALPHFLISGWVSSVVHCHSNGTLFHGALCFRQSSARDPWPARFYQLPGHLSSCFFSHYMIESCYLYLVTSGVSWASPWFLSFYHLVNT